MPSFSDSDDTSSTCSSTSQESEEGATWCCCLKKNRRPEHAPIVRKSSNNDDHDDGLGYAGAAVASVNLSWNALPQGNPPPLLDLRRYLRAGDIFNLLNGNVWGHCVVLVATPRVVEVPVLYEMDDADETAKNPKQRQPLRMRAHNVPVYVCKILQSASNMVHITLGICALTVLESTGEICVVREVRGGVQLCAGRKAPTRVVAECLMSPFSNQTIDFPCFRLAVEEVFRVPQSTEWSFRTAVRSYLRNAKLRVTKYKTKDDKLALAGKICDNWKKRPICSSVPSRLWQKYLLKAKYKEAYRNQWQTNPELEWVDEVLTLMPCKDDRVLPAELVRILTDTNIWKRVDFENGVPRNRQVDAATAESDFFNHEYRPSYRRIPHGLRNEEDFPVQLGMNQFTLYCGMEFEKPQVNKKTKQILWDGRCGPYQGLQCPACRWTEDRLPDDSMV